MYVSFDGVLATMTVTCAECGRTRAFTVPTSEYVAYMHGVAIQTSLRSLDQPARTLISSQWCGIDLDKGLLCRLPLRQRIKKAFLRR